ncbi:Nucleotide-diphospho-sugar transferase [Trypanosoma melophagium]|uniref:Nucleotide-diphospho-sugar transferase n=1 Tax=Trypanosoma melophagium TaxID=715481 RepID=UPI003519DE4A|nr:Nucleotide-diphospho-sugar transferase [Trypanosoma melophagium]
MLSWSYRGRGRTTTTTTTSTTSALKTTDLMGNRQRRRTSRRPTVLFLLALSLLLLLLLVKTPSLLDSEPLGGGEGEAGRGKREGGAGGGHQPPLCPGFDEAASPPATLCVNGAACRAPFSSLRAQPLQLVQSMERNESESASPVCYSSTGTPVASPVWVRPLLQKMMKAGAYTPAISLLQKDPWYMLIGWVSDRFMPPQKPGRRANGDIMLPQTRGTNASYYLEVYGSLWHTEVESGKLRFNFQLIHRNGIAVCVRERIHLFKYHCSPDGNVEPLPIYFCGCRHCRIPSELFSDHMTVSLYQRFPLLKKEPSLVEINPIVRFNSFLSKMEQGLEILNEKNACIGANEAPWLINTSILEHFPYEGMHNDLDTLLATQADSSGLVTMVIFNSFWRDHLHNFVYSFSKKANMRNLIVANLDDDALSLCISFRLPCLNASIFAEREMEEASTQKQGFSRKVTEELSWVKPRLAIAVLRRGYVFLLSDLDITWNRSPMRYLLESREDLVHQCDTRDSLSINSGFYMVRPNERTLRFFTHMMSFRPDESADQAAMRLFMKYDHIHGVSHRCLPHWDFNMKCNYKVERSVRVINGKETFLWKQYPLKEVPKWVLLHATCLSGAKNKIQYFKTIKAWFLDELDTITGSHTSPKKFCVSLRDSSKAKSGESNIVHNVYGTTPHSETYKDATTDPKYLQHRH